MYLVWRNGEFSAEDQKDGGKINLKMIKVGTGP